MYNVVPDERRNALRLPFVRIGRRVHVGDLRELIHGYVDLVGDRLGQRQPQSAVGVGEQERFVRGDQFSDVEFAQRAEIDREIEGGAFIHERRIVRRFAVGIVILKDGAEVSGSGAEGCAEVIEIECSARNSVREVAQEEVIVTLLEIEREVIHRDGIEYVLEKSRQRKIGAEVAAGIHAEAYSGNTAVARFVAYGRKTHSIRSLAYVYLEHAFRYAYIDIVAFLIEFYAQIEVIKSALDIGGELDVGYLGKSHGIADKRLNYGYIGIDGDLFVGKQYLEERRIRTRYEIDGRVLRRRSRGSGSVIQRVFGIAARVGRGIAHRQYAFEIIGYIDTRVAYERSEEAVEDSHKIDARKRRLEEAESAEICVDLAVDIVHAEYGLIGKRDRKRERGLVEVGEICVNAKPYREYQYRVLRIDIDSVFAHSE